MGHHNHDQDRQDRDHDDDDDRSRDDSRARPRHRFPRDPNHPRDESPPPPWEYRDTRGPSFTGGTPPHGAAKVLGRIASDSPALSLDQLGAMVHMTLEQLSEWLNDPANRRRISNLVELLDAQTQLQVCRHRILAAKRLVEVLESSGSPETTRRACNDVLRLRLVDPYKESHRPPLPPLPPPPETPQERIIRWRALSRFGVPSDARDDPEWDAMMIQQHTQELQAIHARMAQRERSKAAHQAGPHEPRAP